ncbi:MAG: SDR family oxidoreductase [Patescibacteria group bacterium]
MSRDALFLGGTKGLGLAMAKIALVEGWQVTVAGRNPEACPIVAEGKATGFRVDLEDGEPTTLSRAFDLIVWTAGAYQEGPIIGLTHGEIRSICRNHLEGPVSFLVPILQMNANLYRPVNLVVVASSSSYRVRLNEGLYGTNKAAKAQLARTLGQELPALIPGSCVLLANPGGMATPFWDGRDRDVSGFMNPDAVARCIWSEMNSQDVPFKEIHVVRQGDGTPKVEYGARIPE